MQLGAKLRVREGIAEASCIMATPANLAQLADADLAIDVAVAPSDLLVVVRGDAVRVRRSDRGRRVDAAVVVGRDERRRRGRVPPAAHQHRARPSNARRRSGPRAHLGAGRLRGGRGAEGAGAGSQRDAVLRQRRGRRRAGDQDVRARAQPARHGTGLRNRDRQRRSAGLRQRRAARRHRARRGVRHRIAGSDVPDPQRGRRRVAGARHRRARPEGSDRRHHDAAGARGARGRSRHPRHRADLEAARAGHRAEDSRARRAGGQACRRAFPRRRARIGARPRDSSPPNRCSTRATWRWRSRSGQAPPASSRRPIATQLAAIASVAAGMAPSQYAVRGLFTGGTFCYEAQLAFRARGLACRSNAPADGVAPLEPVTPKVTSSSTWATTITRAAARIR